MPPRISITRQMTFLLNGASPELDIFDAKWERDLGAFIAEIRRLREMLALVDAYKTFMNLPIHGMVLTFEEWLRAQYSSPLRWISVTERLPEYDVPVHVMTDPKWGRWAGGVSVAALRKNRCGSPLCDEHIHPDYWSVNFLNTDFEGWLPGAFKDFEVTHWMPLPPPPEVQK